MRDAERALAQQAELAYKRNVADWQATRPAKAGASATRGHAFKEPSKGKAAWQTTAPDVCASLRQSLAPNPHDPTRSPARQPLDFLTEKSLGRAVVSGGAGRSSGWRRADSLTFCRPAGLTDRMSCRPPPPEDHRRDLIGAWHSPRLRCVRRDPLRQRSQSKGRWSMIVIGADTHKQSHTVGAVEARDRAA